jgi:hypothetical protein
MRHGVITSWDHGRLTFSHLGAGRGWTAPRSGAHFICYHGRLNCVVLRIAMDRVFTIFRRRFAVETLVQWYRSGQDVERRLPAVSTYLGHVHVADTYWYSGEPGGTYLTDDDQLSSTSYFGRDDLLHRRASARRPSRARGDSGGVTSTPAGTAGGFLALLRSPAQNPRLWRDEPRGFLPSTRHLPRCSHLSKHHPLRLAEMYIKVATKLWPLSTTWPKRSPATDGIFI